MVELQAFTAASETYQHSSNISKVGGGVEEERSVYCFDVENSGASLRPPLRPPPRPPLKRARLENDESSVSPKEMSTAATESGPLPRHRDRQHRVHHHKAVGTTNNFANWSPQQAIAPQQNGLVTLSTPLESHFVGDPHLIPKNNPHAASLFYPHIPGHSAYLGVTVVEVLAELERERRKNAELQGRVSSLEAKLGCDDRHGASVPNGNSKKSKKQRRVENISPAEGVDEDAGKVAVSVQYQDQLPAIVNKAADVVLRVALPLEDTQPTTDRQYSGVTWMSREEVTPADLEKLNLISEKEDSMDSEDDEDDDEDDDDEFQGEEDAEGKEDGREKKKRKRDREEARRRVTDVKEEAEKLLFLAPGEIDQEEDESEDEGKKSRRKKKKEGKKGKRGDHLFSKRRGLGHELVAFRGHGMNPTYKKAPKTAFCPKEVKRIMESGVLALKNAQSHTMRKIIVFASLGIRHGCEDLYELDFKHFSVMQRGEPYKSAKDPGEHVLYDNPGVRKKMFYPNQQNPVLCPVRIVDEEKAMRPLGPTCPSCLFLCIKYGGRTRNLPQNEYVRQRMGRNKLKSFGPLMCQMALLVHIRTGSFFFKALGITLLFMAGFPDDLVRKETKYRNLYLLQKYYRSDEDAKGEQLFHPYPPFYPQALMVPPGVGHKSAVSPKIVGKKGPPPLLSKPPSTPALPRYLQPLTAHLPMTTHFRGMPPAFPPMPSIPSLLPPSATSSGNPALPVPPGPLPPPLPPFGMYPPYPPIPPPGGFPPMPWPVKPYPAPGHFATSPFSFPPFSHSSQFMPPFYGPYQFPPYCQQQSKKKESKKVARETESDSDSDSASGSPGTVQKSEEKPETVHSKDGQ